MLTYRLWCVFLYKGTNLFSVFQEILIFCREFWFTEEGNADILRPNQFLYQTNVSDYLGGCIYTQSQPPWNRLLKTRTLNTIRLIYPVMQWK